MGRRSINTTKSGKFMNPTDQARKEARKRELKKNKRQRMTVRHAVLKSKDPVKILEEIKQIDQIEFDPMNPPTLNEKVLKDKRKKLKETFYRVLKLYEKEDPEFSVELKKTDIEQDRRRDKLQLYYEQVKNTERVKVDQIPLPEIMFLPGETGLIPLPDDVPFPFRGPPRGILKHRSVYADGDGDKSPPYDDMEYPERRAAPPGPPPGTPPVLSDSEDDEYDPEKDIVENIGKVDVEVDHPLDPVSVPESENISQTKGKQRKIKFADDNEGEEPKPEKDTRLTFRKKTTATITPLQIRMLQLAGQPNAIPPPALEPDEPVVPLPDDIPMPTTEPEDQEREKLEESSSDEGDSPDEDDHPASDKSDEDTDADEEITKDNAQDVDEEKDSSDDEDDDEEERDLVPPGPPPGMPPNLMPPGIGHGGPPMPLMGIPTRAPQSSLIRPIGLPPGPPPGLPMSMRGSLMRMPPGLPSGPPPRLTRPPSMPMGVPPPNIPLPPGLGPQTAHPSVLSAPPNIMKPVQSSTNEIKSSATIEAKPQIKNIIGDVTKFMPTALKVKRQIRDSKGRIRHIGKEEEKIGPAPKQVAKHTAQTKTKDHAYEAFMKEMSSLI